MTAFYDILDYIKDELEDTGLINTVSTGDIYDIDLNKKTIFSLGHIMVNQATHRGNVIVFNLTVFTMDIVDVSKEHATDKFRGNDNEKDVLNEMLAAMLRVVDIIRKGENKHRYDLVGEPSLEPFTERFENSLAGWACTMDIMLPNTMNVC